MYQDERAITPNNEQEPPSNEWRRLKIIIKNTSSHSFLVYEDLKYGERLEPESGLPGFTCEKNTSIKILYQRDRGYGPQGTLHFTAKDDDKLIFKLYFDHSMLDKDPRCTYIYQQGDNSIASPICCFPILESGSTYRSDFTISDPVECKNFYHVSDTHFSDGLEKEEYAHVFENVHRTLFERINNDEQSLGLIHTGDICYEDEHFKDYKKYYLKAGRVEDDFKPKYLKNLYEGYGNHDLSDVIDQIKQRHINASGHEKHSYDQCICENYDSYNQLHYYWTWRGVRFIQLNLAPIDEKDEAGNNGYNALSYLKEVLELWGDQKPVILCFHYLLTQEIQEKSGLGFLKAQQIKDFWDVIKDYNICAIICGHIHKPGIGQPKFSFKYNDEVFTTNITCYFSCIQPNKPDGEDAYHSYYYKFKFNDDNSKIEVYYYRIKSTEGSLPTEVKFHTSDIDITARKKPTCVVKPALPEED